MGNTNAGRQVEAKIIAGSANILAGVNLATIDGSGQAGSQTVCIGVEIEAVFAALASQESSVGSTIVVEQAVGHNSKAAERVGSQNKSVVAGFAGVGVYSDSLAVGDVERVDSQRGAGVSVEESGARARSADNVGGSVIVVGAVGNELVAGDQSTLDSGFKEIAGQTSRASRETVVGQAVFDDRLGVGAAGLGSGQEESVVASRANLGRAGDLTVGVLNLLAATSGHPVADADERSPNGIVDWSGGQLPGVEVEIVIRNIAEGAGLALQEGVGSTARDIRTSNAGVSGGVEQKARGTVFTLSVIFVVLAVVDSLGHRYAFAIFDEIALCA